MTDLADLKLLDILPSSISNDEQIRAMAEALQPELSAIQQAIPLIERYSRIDELPEPILRMLAWEHRVYQYEWQLAETIEEKRELVKNSFELNIRRGTRWSIERVFELLNINASLLEWFEYDGDPYRFRVSIFEKNGQAPTPEQIDLMFKMVGQYKPLRSALESVDLVTDTDGQAMAYTGAAVTATMVMEVGAVLYADAETTTDAIALSATGIDIVSTTYPEPN